ncbi:MULTISPECIES: hypothetical protein [Fischerella]|nr:MULTISPECIES: hypothetical protein [Fischerella]
MARLVQVGVVICHCSLGRGKEFLLVGSVLIQDTHTNALPLQIYLIFVT